MLTVLLFGASGSAGGCVLRQCLSWPSVVQVRTVTRRPLGLQHPRLIEFLHDDYTHYDAVREAFAGVDLCLYCLGKSASQVAGEAEYRHLTHDFAMAAAAALRDGSPDAVFHFVSGANSALDSRYMWARVKAETERDLLATTTAVCWRPAAIDGQPSASEPTLVKWLRPAYRLMKGWRSLYVSGDDLGRAMLQAYDEQLRGRIIENREIRDLADRAYALRQFDAIRHG